MREAYLGECLEDDAQAVSALINVAGVHVSVYETLDSTNAALRRYVNCADDVRDVDRTVIIARSQSAGRGRLGRVFVSPPHSGLYMSILYAPRGGITSAQTLTAVAAVAVCKAIKEVYNQSARIKWVNDIFMRCRKVCGILTEAVAGGYARHDRADGECRADEADGEDKLSCAIIGIGVNVLKGALPPELLGVAGSVLEDDGADPRLNQLAAAIINNTFTLLDEGNAARGEGKEADVIAEYRALSILIGNQVIVHPLGMPLGIENISGECTPYKATVVGIDKDAALVVRCMDGKLRTLHSGEVSIGSGMMPSAQCPAVPIAGDADGWEGEYV